MTHCLTICENIVAQSLRWVFKSELHKCHSYKVHPSNHITVYT